MKPYQRHIGTPLILNQTLHTNWVIDISEYMTKKIKALQCYKSQIPKFPGPRSIKSVEALAVFRGTQAGFKFGEAMHIIRKIT